MKRMLLLFTGLLCVACGAPAQTQITPIDASRQQQQKIAQQTSALDVKEEQDPAPKQKTSSAPDWYYIGKASGNAYYVNLSREVVDGVYWGAPAFVITENNTKVFGKIALNCRTHEYKAQFANEDIPWSEIGPGSPLGAFVENVCISK